MGSQRLAASCLCWPCPGLDTKPFLFLTLSNNNVFSCVEIGSPDQLETWDQYFWPTVGLAEEFKLRLYVLPPNLFTRLSGQARDELPRWKLNPTRILTMPPPLTPLPCARGNVRYFLSSCKLINYYLSLLWPVFRLWSAYLHQVHRPISVPAGNCLIIVNAPSLKILQSLQVKWNGWQSLLLKLKSAFHVIRKTRQYRVWDPKA